MKSKDMQRKIICFLTVLMLSALPAYGMDAVEYFNLGLEGGLTYKKIEYFTKALELNPRLAVAYEKRGLLYYFLEKYDNVIHDFQTYVELAPAKAEAYRMLGMGYLKSGIYRQAIYNFTRAIEIDPNLATTYSNRAEAYRLTGNYQKAISDSNRAIELWGDPVALADAYGTRSKVYWEIGRDKEAYADHRKSVNLDPRIPRSWGKYPPIESMRGMSLIVLIGIAFILIFGLKFKPPDKDK